MGEAVTEAAERAEVERAAVEKALVATAAVEVMIAGTKPAAAAIIPFRISGDSIAIWWGATADRTPKAVWEAGAKACAEANKAKRAKISCLIILVLINSYETPLPFGGG